MSGEILEHVNSAGLFGVHPLRELHGVVGYVHAYKRLPDHKLGVAVQHGYRTPKFGGDLSGSQNKVSHAISIIIANHKINQSIVSATEGQGAIKRMKSRGPQGIPSELWKTKSWELTLWLSDFFNQVIQEDTTLFDWQESTTVPIWEKKGSAAECSN